jgi:hypothetical protein
LGELHAAGLAAVDDHDQDKPMGRWAALPVAGDPLLDAVEPCSASAWSLAVVTGRPPGTVVGPAQNGGSACGCHWLVHHALQ